MYIPSLTVEALWENLKKVPDALLAGERGGIKIPEFQLGNSPLEHTSEMVQGKKIIFTSSNCTRIVNIILDKTIILLGALINLNSLKEVIYKLQAKIETPIYLIAVGKKNALAIEDIITAKIIKCKQN